MKISGQLWGVQGKDIGELNVVPCFLPLTRVQPQVQVLCCRQLMLEASFRQVRWEEVGEILREWIE